MGAAEGAEFLLLYIFGNRGRGGNITESRSFPTHSTARVQAPLLDTPPSQSRLTHFFALFVPIRSFCSGEIVWYTGLAALSNSIPLLVILPFFFSVFFYSVSIPELQARLRVLFLNYVFMSDKSYFDKPDACTAVSERFFFFFFFLGVPIPRSADPPEEALWPAVAGRAAQGQDQAPNPLCPLTS